MRTQTEIICAVQKMRDEIAMTCDDMVLSDGTIMYTKEQGLALVAAHDELLDALKRQGGTVEVDAINRLV